MWRLVWARLVLDCRRSLATFLAVWFAVSSFVILTGSTTTQRLEATQVLQDNWRSSFGLLVRPPASRTELETANGQVRQAFLAETYGGLTIRVWAGLAARLFSLTMLLRLTMLKLGRAPNQGSPPLHREWACCALWLVPAAAAWLGCATRLGIPPRGRFRLRYQSLARWLAIVTALLSLIIWLRWG